MLRVCIGRPGDFTRQQTVIDSNAGLDRLSFSSIYPGGWDTCSISWKSAARPFFGATPLASEAVGFGHLTILDGVDIVWEGRVMRPGIRGGFVEAIEATGYLYALEDDFFESRSQQRVSALTLAREAVRQGNGLVTMGAGIEAIDPGGSLVPAEHDGMTAKAILDQLASDGDGANEWGYTVYNRRVTFTARVAPTPVRYVISCDDSVLVVPDYSSTYGAASASYADSNSQITRTTTVSAQAFRNLYGFERRQLVNGGERGASSALRAAQTWLAVHAEPIVTATLARTGRGLETAGGGIVPGYAVRAGEWVQLEGYGAMPIVRASYDATSDQLSVDFGRPAPTTQNATREQHRVIRGLQRNVSPGEIGGPLRRMTR